MIEIKDNNLSERIKQLRKAIEILGGNNLLKTKLKDNNELAEYLLNSLFSGNDFRLHIGSENFQIKDLMEIKLNYEKYFIKNKSKTIESILYKIKQYNTQLESDIRKYKKTNSIENLNKIKNNIEKTYRVDINSLVLKAVEEDILKKSENVESDIYGEYLTQKKEDLILSIMRKYGI